MDTLQPGTEDFGFDTPLDTLRTTPQDLPLDDFGFDTPLEDLNTQTPYLNGTDAYGFDDAPPPLRDVGGEEDATMDVTSPSEDVQLPDVQDFGINGASSGEIQTADSRS
jgi:hypothetical protein